MGQSESSTKRRTVLHTSSCTNNFISQTQLCVHGEMDHLVTRQLPKHGDSQRMKMCYSVDRISTYTRLYALHRRLTGQYTFRDFILQMKLLRNIDMQYR